MKNCKPQNTSIPKRKKGKKIMTILFVIIAVIAFFMLIGTILHSTYYKNKLEQIKPYGQLVDVVDGQMHIYSMGKGQKTIVLLPGMGVSLPSAEFAPLMRKLSEKYTVVCVEYFGVGFSSETLRARTCENYVKETMIALKKTGFKAPYVLMPHSISTVFSEYYASRYPKEVEAIISLDGTSTALYEKIPTFVKSLLSIAKFQQAIGTTSLLAPLAINKKNLISNGYSEEEINNMITFSGFTMNNTILNQIANSSEFIKQTMDLPFPKSIPYLKIISDQTYKTSSQQLKKFKLSPQEYQHKHLDRIGQHAEYKILDGTHFIYVNNAEKIADITDSLLLNLDK